MCVYSDNLERSDYNDCLKGGGGFDSWIFLQTMVGLPSWFLCLVSGVNKSRGGAIAPDDGHLEGEWVDVHTL